MAELERDGWTIQNITFDHYGKKHKVRARITKGDDSTSPRVDAPENLRDMTYSEIIEMMWAEKSRMLSS